MNPIVLFTLATVINVTLSTIRSICTIKCGKWLSAISNAICYGFYPLIVMLTAKDTVTIVTNMVITAVANFICVWLIKYVEEKAKKDKLWKVEMAIPTVLGFNIEKEIAFDLLKSHNIPYNHQCVGKWTIFNCYCMTQEQTKVCADIVKTCGGKISAYENKMGVI